MQNLQILAKKRALGEPCPDPATPAHVSLVQLRIPSKAAPPTPRQGFLPTTRAEMKERGYAELDILIVTGDAYVDHAAFGPILIARFLEALESRRLLDDEHTIMMLEPRAFMWGRAYQGFGLAIEDYGERNRWLTRDDGLEGQNSSFMFRPDSGHLVVVLGNYDAPTAVQLARFVGNRLPSRGLVEMDLTLR